MRKYLNLRANIALGVIFAFLANTFGPLPTAQAGQFYLPAPGHMVALSPAFEPAVLKGIKLDPQNPFRFHFFVDTGDNASLRGMSFAAKQSLKEQSSRLIKYFLASLAIPEKDLWVNLSPYEKDRIVPQEFGQTEMGRDLLAEDYFLKQITASLIYPESRFGKEFWQRIYAQAQAKYGTTNIPVNTFNKVWIVPDKAVVYENGGVAFVLQSHLKVMLEQDYLSLQKHSSLHTDRGINSLGSQIVRQIVIPALTKEVNEGKNFAQLRQVFYSLILATWYKKKIKDSILNKVYSNRNRIGGVNVSAQDKNRIYQEYLRAFKKGVYNYIKEDPDPVTGQTIPRKYFSGGCEANVTPVLKYVGRRTFTPAQMGVINAAQLVDETIDFAMMKNTDLDPLEFKSDLHVGHRDGELQRKGYPIYRIDDHHRVILKPRPADNVLRARFGYEMAYAIGFKGIDKVQIYSRDGVFANIENYWGEGLEDMVGADISYKLFESLNIINNFNDKTYAELVAKFNSSLVRGDIYRLFSNYHADSYSDRNMRVVRLGDHYVIRWVDYDYSFTPSEYLSEYVDSYLKAHADYFVRYGLDLIKAIVSLSDNDIEHIADDVYGKESQQLLVRGKGISGREAEKDLQGFRTAVVQEVKFRRGQFQSFHNWLIAEHKIPQEVTTPAGAKNDAMMTRERKIKDRYIVERVRQMRQYYEAKRGGPRSRGDINAHLRVTRIVNSTRELSMVRDFAMETPRQKKVKNFVFSILSIHAAVILGMLAFNFYHPPSKEDTDSQDGYVTPTNNIEAHTNGLQRVELKNTNGGIDLNPAQMSMQVKKQGEDFKFYFNGTQIDAAQVTGATFTIRQMTPVKNLPQILGIGPG